ncbi:MAG TPA: prepilin-type N-terminal cleavage/methylation domain-containing protein [Geminicoccaceae bacterium]|nr:prepilin-type N-terminal cleavage/methylation domain-containing protein [Geminicoccus sp.]HMU50075.1 prepilin-type N-terminal cleavage/methylation domain-containing protein [Geminicoccaceae bacterium]
MRRTSRAASAELPVLHARDRARGFTLVELLVVLTLLALASAIVLPRFMASAGPNARMQAALVASKLRDARREAVASARPIAVPIDAAGVEATGPDGRRLPEILFFPDGSSSGAVLIVEVDRRRALIEVDDLTGSVRLRDE